MNRIDAIRFICERLRDEILFHANGHICRESLFVKDRPENFYMIGSMGLAPSLALGVAFAKPQRRVAILDGDGSVLMAMGTLAMIGSAKLENIFHFVLDNEAYGSTGEQPTISKDVSLDEVARVSGYRWTARVDQEELLESKVRECLNSQGPSFLLIKVESSDGDSCPRVGMTPPQITNRIKVLLS